MPDRLGIHPSSTAFTGPASYPRAPIAGTSSASSSSLSHKRTKKGMHQAPSNGILLAGKAQSVREAGKEDKDDSGRRCYGGSRWHDLARVVGGGQGRARTRASGLTFLATGPPGPRHLGRVADRSGS